MALPLHERAHSGSDDALVRLTDESSVAIASVFRFEDLGKPFETAKVVSSLIPQRELEPGEQYRFHFDMTKCIGCRSCEIACNEQNGNPADIRWRRIGEIEGGEYPDTLRHYLSMGCNHCVDADCVRGCPVEAYTKDPVTGIVLHSADACIGCQYCVWNCPYSVPQFNAERGVVGKCDMCHGRLTDGLEPACVNACPEAAIEIEIVNIADWKKNYLEAESPGMPDAAITISTTRITLPKTAAIELEKVDAARVKPEHAHLSLVLMTTLMQAMIGAVTYSVVLRRISPVALTSLLLITAGALNVSVFHLGRPAYAYRATKMWRRSWLSREVLFFGIFFGSLAALTGAAWLGLPGLGEFTKLAFARLHLAGPPPVVFMILRLLHPSALTLATLEAMAILSGGAGTVASACIYLVPARPAWNMVHTPVDFILSAALLGVPLAFLLDHFAAAIARFHALARLLPALPALPAAHAGWLGAGIAIAWLANLGIKVWRLKRSSLFEEAASYSLLRTPHMRRVMIACGAAIVMAAVAMLVHTFAAAFVLAMAAVMMCRYLFFVSVVPLNMALTYVRKYAA